MAFGPALTSIYYIKWLAKRTRIPKEFNVGFGLSKGLNFESDYGLEICAASAKWRPSADIRTKECSTRTQPHVT